MRLDGDDFQNRQLLYKDLRLWSSQGPSFQVPRGALQIETTHKAAGVSSLGYLLWGPVLCYCGVQSRAIQWPAVLPTRGLHEGRQVRLRDV